MSSNIKKCCVPGCEDKSSSRHRFPNPKKDMHRLKLWLDVLGNKSLFELSPMRIYEDRRVCRRHFDNHDYSVGSRRIHVNAVPTLYIPGANMPGKRCSIATCNNSRAKTGNTVVYHTFPKNKNIRDVWVNKCRRGAKWNPSSGAICSVHFKEDDYQRDLRAELLNLPRKPKLNPTAIPSLNLNSSTKKSVRATPNVIPKASVSCTQNTQANASTYQESNIFEPVQEIVIMSEVEQETEFDQKIETPELGYHEIEVFGIDDEIKIEELDIGDNSFAVEVFQDFSDENTINASELQFVDASTQTDFDQLMENQKWFYERITTLEKSLNASQNVITGLQGKIAALEYELHKATAISKEHERLKEGIGNILTQSQVDYGVLKNNDVVWTPDDISNAFTIRYFNSRCYTYLRDTLKYPLPDTSSLQRWVSKINLKDGILFDVFRIMKIAGYAMTDFDKNVVLHYAETKVRPLYEYDEIQDEIVGPHSTMLVIMARGLFSDWKQPVYIGFDKKITEEILVDVIERLHEISYNVVACASDCTKTNAELWKELAINPQEPFFLHPATNHKIYFFVDSSHLLTLLHKWFVTSGFVLEDGAKVTKEPLERLIAETGSCCGLTREHLELETVHRRNLAAAEMETAQRRNLAAAGMETVQRRNLAADKMETVQRRNLAAAGMETVQRRNLAADEMETAQRRNLAAAGMETVQRRNLATDEIETVQLRNVAADEMETVQRRNVAAAELETVQRRNVAAARRVFSQTCVAALKASGSDYRARDFVEKISSWFELMNASSGSKKPYGCDIETQNQILDSVYGTVKTMRCTTKHNTLTFQRGMLISINSLKQLFNSMKKTYSANHIRTGNLNLDSLEDLLSQVRSGKDTAPSPLESIRKMRNLLLGDNIGQGNISERDVLRNEYVLTKALTANVSISNPQLIEDDSNSASCSTEQVFLNYLPAWVATKYKDEYPELGQHFCKENYILPSWLHDSSLGILTKPSEKWLRQTELINEIFSYHNENVFKNGKNATGILIDIVIKQYGNMIPKEVISDFVIQRVLVNIRYRNVRLKLQDAGSKRKAVNKEEFMLIKNSKNV